VAAQDAAAPEADPTAVIAQELQRGKELLRAKAYPEAQAAFSAVLELDPTHRDALRLLTKAQKYVTAQRKREARQRARLRERAQDLAIRVAREKQRERADQAAAAERQVADAREQRLKFLYNRGLALYEQGAYQAALTALSPNRRELIIMRDIQGMSYQEISGTLGISLGTVKSRLVRARSAMQKQLKGTVNER